MDSKSIDWEENSILTKLDLANKQLNTLNGISKCKALTWLNISNNSLETLQWLKKLKKLNVLKASNNRISTVIHLSDLSELKALILNNNKLTCIKGIDSLQNLNALVLSHNEIEEIDISRLVDLSKLSLSHNNLLTVPDLKNLVHLKELRLNDNKIEIIPDSVVSCKRLKLIDLGNNSISDFGFLNVLDKIEIENLNLKGNKVCCSEDYQQKVINQLRSLKILDGRRINGSVAEKGIRAAPKPECKEDKMEKNRPEEPQSHVAVGVSDRESNETLLAEKQLSVKEKIVKTGGFVSKFSIENREAVGRKSTKKKKKDKRKKLTNSLCDSVEMKKAVEVPVPVSEDAIADKTDGKLKEGEGNANGMLELERPEKIPTDLITRQSKHGGSKVELVRDKRKRKRKIDKELDIMHDHENIRQEIESESRASAEDGALKPCKAIKSSNGDKLDLHVIEEEGLCVENTVKKNQIVSHANAKSKKKDKKILRRKPEIKESVKEVRKHDIKSRKKKSTKLDSRSGVVAVKLINSRKKKNTSDGMFNFAPTDKNRFEFGTGDSMAW